MNGIIVVDKPPDWTSHDIVAKLRGVLHKKRIGHGGTLDPMATGVLPVFVGRATRAAQFCENAEKEYIAGIRLGVVTDTQDTTGNVISMNKHSVTSNELRTAVAVFTGEQKQIPPMYSAVKIGGKKLYELARRGIETERASRDIIILELELLGGSGDDYTFRVVCSKGTYIRTLCHDIGAMLGCGGAMSSLRRTRAGTFTERDAVSIEAIQEAAASGIINSILRPVDSLFSCYPPVTLKGADISRCKNGAPCRIPGVSRGKCRVYSENGEFLMLGEVNDETLFTVKSFFDV